MRRRVERKVFLPSLLSPLVEISAILLIHSRAFDPHIACGRIFYLVWVALFSFGCEFSYTVIYVSVIIMSRIIRRKPKRVSDLGCLFFPLYII